MFCTEQHAHCPEPFWCPGWLALSSRAVRTNMLLDDMSRYPGDGFRCELCHVRHTGQTATVCHPPGGSAGHGQPINFGSRRLRKQSATLTDMCDLLLTTQGMLAEVSPMQQAITKVKAILLEAAEHISPSAGPQQVIGGQWWRCCHHSCFCRFHGVSSPSTSPSYQQAASICVVCAHELTM